MGASGWAQLTRAFLAGWEGPSGHPPFQPCLDSPRYRQLTAEPPPSLPPWGQGAEDVAHCGGVSCAAGTRRLGEREQVSGQATRGNGLEAAMWGPRQFRQVHCHGRQLHPSPGAAVTEWCPGDWEQWELILSMFQRPKV